MSATPTILFSDPTPEKQLFCLQLFSESAPDNVHICSSPDALIETLSKYKVDILFLNLTLFPDEECISHLDAIQNDFPELLIIAAIPEDQTALEQEILSRNTFFYITIPYKESEVQLALKRALTKLAIQPTDTSVNSRKRLPPFHGIIGETEVMQNLFSLIKKISEDALATVLIRGESGTGKEMVAKAIHRHSSRKNKNFVPAEFV